MTGNDDDQHRAGGTAGQVADAAVQRADGAVGVAELGQAGEQAAEADQADGARRAGEAGQASAPGQTGEAAKADEGTVRQAAIDNTGQRAATGQRGATASSGQGATKVAAPVRENISPGIYLVTDAELCEDIGIVETARAAVDGGVETVQVRHKPADGGEVLDVVLAVAEAIGDWAKIIVNDRVDVFLAARAIGASVHGVHIGQGDLPARVVRKLVGPDAIVGLSASTRKELGAIAAMPRGTIDYVGVGTIRDQSVKLDAPPAMGIDGVSAFASACAVPCVAIGGVSAGDVGPLRRAGLHGAAVVSAICGTPDPEVAARNLVRAWNAAGPRRSWEILDRSREFETD
ncbi:MAG: thiamine phosphate synthase [Actinomycetaceae bacterium]|nr:thiamine phosphate synthase [Actinomycetaceae bacterium]